jgi:hypothetical protein
MAGILVTGQGLGLEPAILLLHPIETSFQLVCREHLGVSFEKLETVWQTLEWIPMPLLGRFLVSMRLPTEKR